MIYLASINKLLEKSDNGKLTFKTTTKQRPKQPSRGKIQTVYHASLTRTMTLTFTAPIQLCPTPSYIAKGAIQRSLLDFHMYFLPWSATLFKTVQLTLLYG